MFGIQESLEFTDFHAQKTLKINYSQGTDTSEHHPLNQRISLSACASSLSLASTTEPSI